MLSAVSVTSTPPRPFSTVDLARFTLALGQERDPVRIAVMLETEACRVTASTGALCVMLDWVRGTCWSANGAVTAREVHDLVTSVASSGRALAVGDALVLPIGAAPARAVLATRRHIPFNRTELAALEALVTAAAPVLDRLMR